MKKMQPGAYIQSSPNCLVGQNRKTPPLYCGFNPVFFHNSYLIRQIPTKSNLQKIQRLDQGMNPYYLLNS